MTNRAYLELGVPGDVVVGPYGTKEFFRLTPRQQEVSSRLRDINPRLAGMYEGALRVLLDEANPDRIAQSSHSIREITNHLCSTGKPLLSKEEEEELKANKSSIRAKRLQRLFDPMAGGMDIDNKLYQIWVRDFYDEFQAISHHKELSPEEYQSKLTEFEQFLLKYGLRTQVEIYQRLDEIVKKGGEHAKAQELALLLSQTSESHRYFFIKVPASWLDFLERHDFLKPTWPVADYLLRIAPERPKETMAIIKNRKFGDDDDRRVGLRFIEAANTMPLEIGVAIVTKVTEERWIEWLAADFFERALNDLLEKLISGGLYGDSLRLAEMLLDIKPLEAEGEKSGSYREARGYIDDYHYAKAVENLALVPDNELDPFIKLLIEKLCKAISFELLEGRKNDGSSGWRPAIEEHEQNWNFGRVKESLVASLRKLLERRVNHLKASGEENLAHTLHGLLQHEPEYSILRRLKLHIYRLHPDNFKAEIEQAVIDGFNDLEVWHEYTLLLDAVFPALDDETKTWFFEMVGKGPEGEKEDRYRRYWKAQWLAVIKRHLAPDKLQEYRSFLRGFQEPEEPYFLSTHSSWTGPTSPAGEETLKSMSVTEIVSYLIDWTPDKVDFAPSPEGLGRVMEKVVTERAKQFSSQAEEFSSPELRPVYLYHFCSGLADAVKNKETEITWAPVVKLVREVVEKAKSNQLAAFKKERQLGLEIGWDGVFEGIARLLSNGMKEGAGSVPWRYRGDVWNCIEFLCLHPDPTPEQEERSIKGNNDPFHLSLNTVRGEAFHALFGYLFWWNRHSRRPQGKKPVIPPDVKRVLERHLDPEHEPSLTIRSVYGRYLPWLFAYDQDWTRRMANKIFPADDLERWYTAWETYLINAVHEDLFHLLRPQYEQAIADLSRKRPQRTYFIDPIERLAVHIMIAYAYGIGEENGSLFTKFFKTANGNQRAKAVSFAGRAYITRDQMPKGERLPDFEPLKKFWEWRLAESRSESELRAFGWWVKEDKFDNQWLMEKLVETLTKTRGAIDADFRVIETIQALAEDHPLLCAKALDLMLRSKASQRYWFYGEGDRIKGALVKMRKHGDEDTQKLVSKLVDYLTKLGGEHYREVLENQADLPDESAVGRT